MDFSSETREKNIREMGNREFDLVVIGGGITGAGIARDAVLRGLSVALVEKGDFASGTSSKSARMVHGGFRYLEQFQFGLVINACTERHNLFRLAPRLVRPAAFVFPVYRHTKNSLTKINLGMWLYEFLSLFRNFKIHRILPSQAVKVREPAVSQDNLDGAVCYYDCLTDDARLTLETVKAAHVLGALVSNYSEVTRLNKEHDKVTGINVLDVLSGENFNICGNVIVNATGVWVDKIRLMDDPKAKILVHANRGSHIVVLRERVPINDVIIFTSIDGERGMYAVPWGNTVIVGTTDLNHQGELDGVYATQDEVTSMLAAVNHVFPAAQLSIQDVFSSFAGLRPLVGEVESSGYTASRDHEIFESPSGLVSISGGKLTTHRKMAKDLVDHVVAKLYKEGMLSEKKPCTSAESPLSSLANVSNDEQTRLAKVYPNLDQNIIKHLVDTYGLNAEKILSMPNGQDNLLERIIPDCAYIYAEIPYAIQHEMAMTLSDILIRRTHIIYEARDLGLGAASKIAEIMGSYLGWDSARKEREILDYQEKVMLARTFLPGAPQTSN